MLAGSPSVPLATTMGNRRWRLRPRSPTGDGLQLRARREPGAAAPPEPGARAPRRRAGPRPAHGGARGARTGRGGRPGWWRWARRSAAGASWPAPAGRSPATLVTHARGAHGSILSRVAAEDLVQQLRRGPRPPGPAGVQRPGRPSTPAPRRDEDRRGERGEPQLPSIRPARPRSATRRRPRTTAMLATYTSCTQPYFVSDPVPRPCTTRDRPRCPRRPCTVRQRRG